MKITPGDKVVCGLLDPVLVKCVYDVAKSKEETKVVVVDTVQEANFDFLARYIDPNDPNGAELDAIQAEFVAKRCKNDFRKRLLDRAQIIQQRLEEENENFQKRRNQMQRRGDNPEKDEKAFETYQNNALFRIKILEQRLARHEYNAIKKFVELEKALAEDPRLQAMWKKKT